MIRVHAFLEKWGLINFNVSPDLKPQRFSLIKETTFDKVLVNATNKHHLTKNEGEYLGNLFEVPDETTAADATEERKMKIDGGCLRQLNLLTAKERPFCSVCNALVGFTWRRRPESTQLPEICCN